MDKDRTLYSEQDIEHLIHDAEYRHSVAKQNKQRRHRQSKCDPHRALILELHERGMSLNMIRLVLSGGRVKPVVQVGKTTIHDYINRCLSDA